jgi:hypothetical protein
MGIGIGCDYDPVQIIKIFIGIPLINMKIGGVLTSDFSRRHVHR